MPANIKPLKIRIMGDAKNAEQAFDQARAAANVTAKAIAASFAAAAGAFSLIDGSVVKTSAEFERFRTQLDTIEGSSTKAAASMDWITQFTKNTPFELATVTDAFVQLKAFGIDPIANDSLKILGNTSAAMGRTLDQSVQALADAATGEFERLKEFGIKASTVGNQVQFSYQQNGQKMVATADKTSQAMIQKTLLGIWNDKYAGGMDKLSHTWDGMTSNMADNWNLFKKSIGDAGAFNAAKNSLSIVLDELNKNDAEVQALATNISDGLITSMEYAVTWTALMAKGFAALTTVTDGVRGGIDAVSLSMVEGFDAAVSGLQSFYDALAHLPGDIGQTYAQASKDIGTFRADLGHLEEGIKQTGGESMAQLSNGIAALGDEFSAIDKKAVKFVSAMEKARGAAAGKIPGPQPDTSGSTQPGAAVPASSSAAVDKARAAAQKIIDLHQAKFDRLAKMADLSAMTDEARAQAEVEKKIAALEAEKTLLEDHDAFSLEREQAFIDARASIVTAGEKKVADIRKRNMTDIEKFQTSSARAQVQTISGMLMEMTASAATKSRAMFEVNKVASIANAIVKGIEAVQSAYAYGSSAAGPVGGAALAAIAVAATAANVAKIASTSFGSRSAGGAVTGGGGAIPSQATSQGVPVTPTAAQPAQPAQTPQPIQILVVNRGNGTEFIDTQVIPHIQDRVANADIQIIDPRSRQAQTILAAAA